MNKGPVLMWNSLKGNRLIFFIIFFFFYVWLATLLQSMWTSFTQMSRNYSFLFLLLLLLLSFDRQFLWSNTFIEMNIYFSKMDWLINDWIRNGKNGSLCRSCCVDGGNDEVLKGWTSSYDPVELNFFSHELLISKDSFTFLRWISFEFILIIKIYVL